jgi:single-stranded DNA-binding protein
VLGQQLSPGKHLQVVGSMQVAAAEQNSHDERITNAFILQVGSSKNSQVKKKGVRNASEAETASNIPSMAKYLVSNNGAQSNSSNQDPSTMPKPAADTDAGQNGGVIRSNVFMQ